MPNILKAIELGPVNDKLAAIGKLHVIKGISLDVVQPVLDKIIMQASDGSLLKFCAAANLAALGDNRDIIVDTLIPYLGAEVFEIGGQTYDFPWLINLERFHEGVPGVLLRFSTQLATVEALSHIRANHRAADKLLEVLGLLDNSGWRTLTIYALGANGNPASHSTLEYYRDNHANSLEGKAARIALENFGTATLLQLAQLHRDSK